MTDDRQMSDATRRGFLAGTIALASVVVTRSVRATPATMAAAIRKVVGEAPLRKGKVMIDVPPLVENGNTVPVTVSVESPMTAARSASCGRDRRRIGGSWRRAASTRTISIAASAIEPDRQKDPNLHENPLLGLRAGVSARPAARRQLRGQAPYARRRPPGDVGGYLDHGALIGKFFGSENPLFIE